jgi:hypothetical protein
MLVEEPQVAPLRSFGAPVDNSSAMLTEFVVTAHSSRVETTV